jgi:hypothetical protein
LRETLQHLVNTLRELLQTVRSLLQAVVALLRLILGALAQGLMFPVRLAGKGVGSLVGSVAGAAS